MPGVLVATDGFDMYNGTGANTGSGAKWVAGALPNSGGSGNPSLVAGRFGGQAMRHRDNNTNGGGMKRFLKATYASCTIGFAFRSSSLQAALRWGLISGSSTTFYVALNADGSLSIWRCSGTNVLGNLSATALLGTSAPGVYGVNQWQYLEIIVAALSTTVGAVSLNVEGANVLSVTGANTTGSGATTVDAFHFQGVQYNNGIDLDIDDWHENSSTTPIGPMRIDTLRPSSDQAVTWSRSAGANNYALVNETLVDGNTTYVETNVVNNSDLYGLGSLPVSPATIYGVQAVDFAEKTDASTRTIYQQVKSGATLDQGAARALTTSYDRYERMLTQDPDTAAAWTLAAVNALQRGPALAA
jgi:hypothetical protein